MKRPLMFFAAGLCLALGVGWLVFPRLLYVKADQPLQFNHATHTSGAAGLACADCHGFRADGRFAGIPTVASCANCHADAIGNSAEEQRLVVQYVKPGREIPWRVYARQPDNVQFPHAAHVKRAAIACERCHGAHGSSTALPPFEADRITRESRNVWGPSALRVGLQPGQGMKMSDCEACHAEHHRGGTACLDCHR